MPPHDQLFKQLLETFFGDLLRLAAPEQAARLRLEEVRFLDKETFTDLPQGQRREVDLLAEVPAAAPPGEAILVHVEIEAAARRGMPRRLWRYYLQLQLRHGRPVFPIVVNLRGGRPGVTRGTFSTRVLGSEVARFRYTTFGLAGCRAEDYLARSEPLAWGLAALMSPARLRPAEHKIACLQTIAQARLGEVEEFLLVNCVETYLQLSEEDEMEYTTLRTRRGPRKWEEMIIEGTWAGDIHAKGVEQGVEQGVKQGVEQGVKQGVEQGVKQGVERGLRQGAEALRQVIVHQLEQRFGPLPATARRRLAAITSLDRLAELGERLLQARSLAELELE